MEKINSFQPVNHHTSPSEVKTEGKNFSHKISKESQKKEKGNGVKGEWEKNLPSIQAAMQELEILKDLEELDKLIHDISILSIEDYQTINEESQKSFDHLRKDLKGHGLSQESLSEKEIPINESTPQKTTEEKPYSLSKLKDTPIKTTSGKYKEGEKIGDLFIALGRKKRGVEEGFEAIETTLKFEEADLKEWIELQWGENETPQNETLQNIIKEIITNDKKAPSPLNREAYETYINKHKEDLVNLLIINPKVIQEYKFIHKHYVKLDYGKPNKKGEVSIPLDRAKTLSDLFESKGLKSLSKIVKKSFPFLDKMAQKMHQKGTFGTPTEKNLGAITEVFANDLFKLLGLGGQELRLVPSKYEDGQSKLLLDGTHITGPKGEKFRTFEDKKIIAPDGKEIVQTHIKKGRLVENGVMGDDGIIYPFDEEDLAKALALSLLFGDHDKVGSGGGNIGFIIERKIGENGKIESKARLMNIDPGKSLEKAPKLSPSDIKSKGLKGLFLRIGAFFTGQTDRMRHRNLNNDFSFSKPNDTLKDKFAVGYKNFTIFQDTILSVKIKAMQSVIDNWDKVEKLFETYKAQFNEGDLDFQKQIQETQDRLTERMYYFKAVLNDRLLLLKDKEILNGKEKGPQMVDFLDNVEKLTSGTVIEVGKGDKRVQLQHLLVKPEERKPWKLLVNSKTKEYTLVFESGNRKEQLIVKKRFMDFYAKSELNRDVKFEEKDFVRFSKNRFEFTIQGDKELARMMEMFDEQKIIGHKHGEKYLKSNQIQNE